MFCPFALEYNPISDWGVLDESSDFFFPILIDKDKRVVLGVSSIVLVPSFSGMHKFFFFVADGDVGRGGEPFKKGLGSLVLTEVGFDGVGEGGNVGEMGNAVVLLVGDGEGDRLIVSCHRSDDGVHIFGDQVYMVVSLRVVLFVAEYRLADSNGAVDLRARGECGLEDLDSDTFDFIRRGGRETREVFLDLVRCGTGCLLANTPFESRKGVVVGGAAW